MSMPAAVHERNVAPEMSDWKGRVARVAEIAANHADDVDVHGRFPTEAIDAMRREELLGAWISCDLGGLGLTLSDIAYASEQLGQSCASAGMIFAMHQIEIAVLVRHAATTPYFQKYLREAALGQRLVASATSEIGVGGDLRNSKCALAPTDHGTSVHKCAPVISYGNEADDILLTARRAESAMASDQVAVLVGRDVYRLTQTATWNALGFRGTCSHGFELHVADVSRDAILPVHFATIAAETMVPTSHTLWASLWLGIATDAVRRTRNSVRKDAKRQGTVVTNSNTRLAELVAMLHAMRTTVHGAVSEYASLLDNTNAESDTCTLQSMSYAIRINNVKVSASTALVNIVQLAMQVSGISGYRLDSPTSLGRALRDAFGAVVMINNDRILAANAVLLMASRED